MFALVFALQTIAVQNVNVVPMDREQVLRDHVVLVQNGRISAVGRRGSVQIPRNAERMDGRGGCAMTWARTCRAATRNAGAYAAEHLRSKNRFGTIAPGQRADLVLVSRNPLEDITALRAPMSVMARGIWLNQTQLQELLQTWSTSTN